MDSYSNFIEPSVRLLIVSWPDDAPRGAVSAFCREHGISRKSFYALRQRARLEGMAATLEPRSRRPKTSPSRLSDEIVQQALATRAALAQAGWDHGPISVHDKMKEMGIQAPSTASLARLFRARGVARAEPKKRPRASYRRFVYPLPNACWQLDATEWVLAGGDKCVIFQLEDDHSRLAVASLAARSENTDSAIDVFTKGVAAYGLPQRLLTDNGAALNPQRRGFSGGLAQYVQTLGVKAITGKPYKPTTQGKNERFHQTLFKWLNAQPPARTLEELQAQLDQFDREYNNRPHQGLPERKTPLQVWQATEPAPPPPPEATPSGIPLVLDHDIAPNQQHRGRLDPNTTEKRIYQVYSNGNISVNDVSYYISTRYKGLHVHVSTDQNGISITNCYGEIITEYDWAPPHEKYMRKSQSRPQVSPMS